MKRSPFVKQSLVKQSLAKQDFKSCIADRCPVWGWWVGCWSWSGIAVYFGTQVGGVAGMRLFCRKNFKFPWQIGTDPATLERRLKKT
jgi:hypothetical protein